MSCFKEHSGKMFHSFKNLLCMAMTFNAFDDQNHSLCDVELVHVFLVIYCVICMCYEMFKVIRQVLLNNRWN